VLEVELEDDHSVLVLVDVDDEDDDDAEHVEDQLVVDDARLYSDILGFETAALGVDEC
jgi:hypothetical protein